MSGLAPSEPLPLPETGYWGWGGSNQTTSNFPNARNLGPGMDEPDLQSDLYVPDVGGNVADLEARVTVLEGQMITVLGDIVTIQADITIIDGQIVSIQNSIVTINGQIVTINAQIVTIQNDIIAINAQIAAILAMIIPVSFNNFGNTPNPAGASVASNVITLQPASNLFPGGVNLNTQTFGGAKTFADPLTSTISITTPNLLLPTTTSITNGTIQQNSLRFIHSNGTNSVFVGENSGSYIAGNARNVGLGWQTLSQVGSAVDNIAIGANAGASITTGSDNIYIGSSAGQAVTTASHQIILGTPTSTNTTIYGIAGVAVGGTTNMVTIDTVSNRMGSTAIPASGVLTLSAIGATPNANAATIAGTVLNLEPASASFGGVATTAAQTFAGLKTFSSGIQLPTTGGTPATFDWYSTSTALYTPTMNAGSIITMTSNGAGATQLSIRLTRTGNVVNCVIPQFSVTVAVGGGDTIFVNGVTQIPAEYRPTVSHSWPIILTNSGTANQPGVLYLTGAGILSLQRENGNVYNVTYGLPYNFGFCWMI